MKDNRKCKDRKRAGRWGKKLRKKCKIIKKGMIRKRRKWRDKEVESDAISNEANRKKGFFFKTTTTNNELPAGCSYLHICTTDSTCIRPTRIPH
jgi:hypothetical protein